MLGFQVWYDNRANDLTKEGMLKGIQEAAAFILFLRWVGSSSIPAHYSCT